MQQYLLRFTFLAIFTFFGLNSYGQACVPTYNNACTAFGGDFIDDFSTTLGVTNISNLGTGCNGALPNNLTVFPMTVSQVQGQSFDFSIGFSPQWTEGVRIFVDWNQDNDFLDLGEDVWNGITSGVIPPPPLNGTINVPFTATPGICRMRVVCQFNTIPAGPCDVGMGFGETEEYNVNVIASTPCSAVTAGTSVATPNNPCAGTTFNLGLSGATLASGLNYLWLQSTTGPNGPWDTLTPSVTTPTANLPAPLTQTWYRCAVTCTNTSNFDTSVVVSVAPAVWTPWSLCYCYTSLPTNAGDTDIGQVVFGTLSNPSVTPVPQANNPLANGTFSNFDTLTPIPNYIKGQGYPLNIYQYSSGGMFDSWAKVFIDFNHNHVFNDPGEEIFSLASNAANGYNPTGASVVIPNTPAVLPGLTRMRVVLQEGGSAAATDPCTGYTWGETEDYVVNILNAGPIDPAVTNIQATPSSGCMDSNGTVIVTLGNFGSQNLDPSVDSFDVTLRVTGPNGLTTYTQTVSSGTPLQPSNINSSFLIFNGVNFHEGGCYDINTDTITMLSASTNANLVNDSLFSAITICNSRPNAVDYTVCIGDTIPTGQGLGIINCPTGLVQDSVIVPFTLAFAGNNIPNPTAGNTTGASHFATGTLPTLPPGANILSGEISVTNLNQVNFLHWASHTRFNLYDPNPPNFIYHGGLQGNPVAFSFPPYDYLSNPAAADLNAMYTSGTPNLPTINMGYWSVGAPAVTTAGATVNAGGATVVNLKIVYEYVPMGISWYEQKVGGVRISDSTVFNPFITSNSIVSNSSVQGNYTFFGACAADTNCRVEVDLIVTGLNRDSIVVSNPVCNGDSNGTIQAYVSGGTPGYQYFLRQGATVIDSNYNGLFDTLSAGTYIVNVIDTVGCSTGDTTITLSEPPAIVFDTVQVTNVLCNGDTTGAVYVHAQGSGLVYQNNLGPTQVSGSFTGLGAGGPFSIRASHSNGACFLDTSYSITEPLTSVGFASASVTNVSCNGGANGSITVVGTGGTPGTPSYSYQLNPPSASNTTGVFGGLSAGTDTVRVIDANGCTHDTILTITEPVVLTIDTASVTQVLCFGDTTGQIVMTSSGGTGVVTYTINPSATQGPSGTFTGLGFGSYTVTGTDANSCTAVTTVMITQPASAVQITNITSTIPSCVPGCDATMTVTASGGTPNYTYSHASAAAQPSPIFTNQCAGGYNVTVTDANGCTAQSTHTISTPGSPTWSTITTDSVDCNGGNDGSFTVNVLAGTSPIDSIVITAGPTTIPTVLSTGSTTGTANSLVAGVYTVRAVDTNGCAIVTNVTVGEPAVLAISSVVIDSVNCNGGNDGIVTVTVTGGTAAYNYCINTTPVQCNGTGIFTGLSQGPYVVTVTDANNCSTTTNVIVNQPTALSYTNVTVTNVSCNGAGDGAISATASGGTGTPLLIGLPTAGIPSPANFTGLNGGPFTLRITDVNNCTLDSVVTIAEPALLTIDTSGVTQVLCHGDSTGIIVMSHVGGTNPVNYMIMPSYSNTLIVGNTISNLPAGSYTITGTDANNCTALSTITITEPTTPVDITAITGTTPSCTPGNDGTITVTASGGTGALEYGRLPIPPNSYQASNIFTGLGSGSYTIRVRDANLCFADTTYTITNSSAPTIDSVITVMTQCNGDSTGSMMVYATGTPQSTVTYQIVAPYVAPVPPQYNGSFTGLHAGFYTIEVNDTNNCPVQTTVQITEPTAVVFTNVTTDSVDCFGGNDGSIVVSANGGTPGYTYSIAPPATQSPVGTFINLFANPYTVTITDTNGCTSDSMIVVHEPGAVTVDTTWTVDVLCNGDSTGGITIQSSGGTGTIYHAIGTDTVYSNPAFFTNYAAGPYVVTSVDANGCTVSTNVIVTEPAALSHSYVLTNVGCFGGNDGTITFTASGGISPYGYTLYNGSSIVNSDTSGAFTSLTASTNYLGVITDSNGCVDSSVLITITQPTQVLFTSVTKQDIDCFGQSTGSISASASGGTGSVSISIPSYPTQASPATFNNLPAGTYVLTATDANGCSSVSTITIIENPPIFFSSITNVEETCYGDGTASISFQAAGGVGGFSYTFNVGPNQQGPNAQTTYSGLSTGTYIIRATDALNCVYDSSYTLSGPDRINFPTFNITPTTCLDTEDGKLTVVAAGGRGNVYTYSLEPGFYVNTNGLFRDLAPRQYTLRTTDTAGCYIDTTFGIPLPSNPMVVSISKDDLGCHGRGNEGKAEAIVTGGTPPYTYLWSSTPVQTTSRATGLYQGFHTVDIVDANGCLERDTLIIEPGPCCQEVFLPNAFSPNNDGRNDEFRILSTAGIELQQFEIRNRWGIKVWETNNVRSSWDGRYGDQTAPVATYYYVIRYKCLTDGEEYTMKGDVILVR